MNIFFISTNTIWSGSEILWYETSLRLLSKGHSVSYAVHYQHEKIDLVRSELATYVNLKKRIAKPSMVKRIINKVFRIFLVKDTLRESLIMANPELVVISQGKDFGSLDIMSLCLELNLKYITITQLVTESQWLSLNDYNYTNVIALYEKSVKNYFVSHSNMRMHELMLGGNRINNEVIFNPALANENQFMAYPDDSEVYKLAFVGRLECFHKGLDMLVQIASEEKWQNRPVTLALYGHGPHEMYLSNVLGKQKKQNIFLKGYASDVTQVWSENHIMILPSRMEGQSLALLEALACGRTAIVTDVGGAREIIHDNVTGFIARSATVHDLEDAMERAWQHRHLWKSMGESARADIKKIMPVDAVGYFVDKLLALINVNRA